MKKKILVCLALMMTALLLLAACGGDDAPPPQQAQPPAAETPAEDTTPQEANGQDDPATDDPATDDAAPPADDGGAAWDMAPTTALHLGTGGTAGTYYPLGGVFALVISDRTNINMTITATGASADNIQQLALGHIDVALAQNDVMNYAFTGTGIWVDNPAGIIDNLATLMTLYPETVQIVVDAGSGIYSVEDLAGARVSIGATGSGVEANAMHVLGAHGITRDDISVFNLNFADSAGAVRDNLIDAFFVTAATPNVAVMELATARDLRILSIADDRIDALMAAYPFYGRVTITTDDYAWLEEPVQTLAVQATLVTTTDLPEQVAYDIVRALIEGQADVQAGHARGADISPENAVYAVSVPFHPGAERFFREIGVLD